MRFTLVSLVLFAAAAVNVLVPSSVFASVLATDATFHLTSTGVGGGGPPLPLVPGVDSGIDALRSNPGGIFTNQLNGFAGAAGTVRTVSAVPITVAQDGVTFTGVQGPNSPSNAIAFVALEGSLVGLNSVNFTAGRAFIVETTTAFLNRDPSTWGYSTGSLLSVFDLASPDNVIATSQNIALLASVPASDVNDSTGDALSIGNTDFQLLFREASPAGITTATLGDNWMRDLVDVLGGAPIAWEGLFVEGEQDLVSVSGGFNIGGTVFDATDLAVLDAIAAAAGFSDLSAAAGVQGFASGLGVGGGGPTPAFFMDLSTGPGPTKEGDLFASTAEFNAYPVLSNVPEAASIAVWSVLLAGGGIVASRAKWFSKR